MRVADLLRSLPVQPAAVVDRTSEAFGIGPLVQPLPVIPNESADDTALIVAAFSTANSPSYASVADALAAVDGLAVGSSVLLLSAESVDRWPIAATLEWATRNRVVLHDAEALSYRWFRSGAIATVVDQMAESQELRNEMVLRRPVQRALDTRVRRAEHRAVRASREVAALRPEAESDSRRANELSRRLANAEARSSALEDEVEGLKTGYDELVVELDRARAVAESTTYRLGYLLRTSAKPSRRTLKLPKELVGLWRGRGAWRSTESRTASSLSGPHRESRHVDARLMWAFRTLPGASADMPIALVGSAAVVSSTTAWGGVVPLWPNDASDILAGVEAGALVIESGAALPGEAWTTLGQPMSGHLDLTVRSLIDQCRRRDVPTIFWWTTGRSASPGLQRLADLCDHVAADPLVPGVPDGHLLPVPLDPRTVTPSRPAKGAPVRMLDAPTVPAAGVEAAILAAAGHRGLITFAGGSSFVRASAAPATTAEAAAALSEAQFAVAMPFQAAAAGSIPPGALRAIASGQPVLAARGSVPAELAEQVIELLRVEDVDRLDELLGHESVATASARCRVGLDVLWRTASWPAMLGEVFDACGLDGAAVRRRLSYTVSVDAGVAPDRLMSNLLAQSAAPTDVSLAHATLAVEVGPELEAAGIAVRVDEPEGRVVTMRSEADWAPWYASVALASLEVTGASSIIDDDGAIIAGNFAAGIGRQVTAWWMVEETRS